MQRLEEIKAELFSSYEVRKTDAQKTAFIEWAKAYADQNGVPVQVEESGKLMRTRNIVFGDLKTARKLITAHYDTCARMLLPNFHTPDCWPVIIFTQGILPFAIFTALGFCAGNVFSTMLSASLPAWAAGLLSLLLAFAVVGAAFGLMLFGPANPHTANDNTSGVAAVLRLIPEFKDRRDVAFVLFDNEEIGLLGSSAFIKAHRLHFRQAFVINLDCISDGHTLAYVYSKAAKRSPLADKVIAALEETAPQYGKRAMHGQSPKVLYPSDQLVFVKGTAFAALKGKRILYMDRIHTAKDTVFDDANLLCLAEVIKKAI